MKRAQTPSFLLELPLQVTPEVSKHLRGHFEAGRCLYNALLGEAMKRLHRMRADPRWPSRCACSGVRRLARKRKVQIVKAIVTTSN
jgi:hypothetical protein